MATKKFIFGLAASISGAFFVVLAISFALTAKADSSAPNKSVFALRQDMSVKSQLAVGGIVDETIGLSAKSVDGYVKLDAISNFDGGFSVVSAGNTLVQSSAASDGNSIVLDKAESEKVQGTLACTANF